MNLNGEDALCGALAAFVFALPVERWAWSMAWHGQRVTAVANSPYGKTILLERGERFRPLRRQGLRVARKHEDQIERAFERLRPE